MIRKLASWVLAVGLLFGTSAGSAACQQMLTHRPARHVLQLGTYPHCRFGVAHADGLPPQCSMPEPKNP